MKLAQVSELLRIIRALEAQQSKLDLLILKTPTSKAREDLTSANIHLLVGIGELRNAFNGS